ATPFGKGCHPSVRRPRRRTLNSYGSLMTVSTRSTQPCLSYIVLQLAFIQCFTRAPGQRRLQSFRSSPAKRPWSLRPRKVSTSSARRQTQEIPAELLEPISILACDGNAAMQVEAVTARL